MIRQRAQSVLAGFGQAKINTHVCQNVSRCISDMNKLTLNDSPQMIRVTPLPKVFSAVAFAKSRETNALASLENSSMEDSGVFMSVDRHSSTNKDVSECSSGNAETSSRSVDDDVMLSQVMQSDSCISPTACFNKPLLPSGVIKVNGPPPLPKSATHLPPGLLSRVTEFIQQNPKMAQDAVGQTSRTKRQCEFGVHQRKRKKAAECHSKVVSETESDSALASSCHLSLSSSELGSVHSGDGYFWDSPFLSQSDNTHDETGGKCLQHEKAHRDCEADTLDRMCRCVLCSVETERPLSGASASSTASTVFGPSDTAVLFSDTDKSDVTDDVYKKSCKKNVQQEKQTKKKKQKKKKKDTQHTEMSADIDGGETTSKRQTPNYFIAIQVANPEIHNRLRAVQEDIVSSSEQLRAALIPLATLHLTLMVMHLSDSDEQLNRAKIALDNCGMKLKDDLSARQLEFNVQGLGNFRNNVIFAKVENGQILDQLSHIAETVMATFAEECGILPVDNKGFKPHITIMKLSRSPKLRKKGVHKIEPALYESYVHTTFGRDCVHSLQLCSMFKPKDAKGYYHVAHTVPVQNYSTTAMPPGGRVTHCGPGNVEHQNDGIHNQGDKGEHAVDEGPRERGDDGGASVTFAEHLEIPMEWAFHAPDDS